MARAKGGISFDEQIRLIDAIEAGDPEAIREAQQLSAQLAKRANVRLKALEDSSFTSFQYRKTKYQLNEEFGREKFSESKKLTGDELVEQLEMVNEFLNAEQQTTISAIRAEKEEKTEQSLRQAGIIPEDMKEAKVRELHRFLKSDAWKEIKASQTGTEGGTGGYLVSAIDAIENGAKVRDLEKMYRDFNDMMEDSDEKKTAKKDISVFDIMEGWLEV